MKFLGSTSAPYIDTDMHWYAVPGAPEGGLNYAVSKMADEEFCCRAYFIVVDISVTCEHISFATPTYE